MSTVNNEHIMIILDAQLGLLSMIMMMIGFQNGKVTTKAI